jgi:hypothetical protein
MVPLHADISYANGSLSVRNRDSFDWDKCDAYLDSIAIPALGHMSAGDTQSFPVEVIRQQTPVIRGWSYLFSVRCTTQGGRGYAGEQIKIM